MWGVSGESCLPVGKCPCHPKEESREQHGAPTGHLWRTMKLRGAMCSWGAETSAASPTALPAAAAQPGVSQAAPGLWSWAGFISAPCPRAPAAGHQLPGTRLDLPAYLTISSEASFPGNSPLLAPVVSVCVCVCPQATDSHSEPLFPHFRPYHKLMRTLGKPLSLSGS